jgi:hypothetical protein
VIVSTFTLSSKKLIVHFLLYGLINHTVRECGALTLADVHVWLLIFVDDLVLTSELEMGL